MTLYLSLASYLGPEVEVAVSGFVSFDWVPYNGDGEAIFWHNFTNLVKVPDVVKDKHVEGWRQIPEVRTAASPHVTGL